MKEKHIDSVQNRFSAYLQAAITNRRIHYFDKRRRLREREQVQIDLLEKGYTDFEIQFSAYKRERDADAIQNWEQIPKLLAMMESNLLIKEIGRLKERERMILFARVFGELSFQELGDRFDLSSKQAEMSYYYIVRKIRRRMEGWKDEF